MYYILPLLYFLITNSQADIWQDLHNGNHTIMFRHAQRDLSAPLPKPLAQLDFEQQCIPGTQLSPSGLKEVHSILSTLQTHQIPIAEIFFSPTCRTEQMADILSSLSDRQKTSAKVLAYLSLRNLYPMENWRPQLIQLLTTFASDNSGNRILIGHSSTLSQEGYPIYLNQGDAAIFKMNRQHQVQFIRKIPIDDWSVKDQN